MNETETLKQFLQNADNAVRGKLRVNSPRNIVENVNFMLGKVTGNKSLVSALITSILKKILTPEQDIRLHRADFRGGYSARVLDTRYVTPFFKRNFPKYANKESAFLTLATREKIKWTKRDGLNLKIRDKPLKKVFLTILDEVEKDGKLAGPYLLQFFIALTSLSAGDEKIFRNVRQQKVKDVLNIDIVLKMLGSHFSGKLSSRLPVIAIYSVYEVLMPSLARYKGKKLVDLAVHTSADKHGFGDVEIYNGDNTPFEIIEIKHNIPITKDLVFDVVEKSENTDISRYYILTTYKAGFENAETEKEVREFIVNIKRNKNMDIIANGILMTIKYYLRFVDDYSLFLKTYEKNLIKDAKNSTEVKNHHIQSWGKIKSGKGV